MKGVNTQTLREKEVKAISSIVRSICDSGDKLYILTKAVAYKGAGSLEELSALGADLIEKHPDVAFLLTVTKEESDVDPPTFHWILSISDAHPTMGSDRYEIFDDVYKAVVSSPVVYYPDVVGYIRNTTWDDYKYFSRVITKNEYVGKIVDAAVSITFEYLRVNKYIPKEEDEVDELAALDDMMKGLDL
jgi:hypothetical protein